MRDTFAISKKNMAAPVVMDGEREKPAIGMVVE